MRVTTLQSAILDAMMRTIMLFSVALASTVIGCKSDNRSAAPNPVEWAVSDSTAEIRSGFPATLRVAAVIDSGWYIYSLTQKSGGPTPMTISVGPSPPFRLEGI